MKRNLGTHKLNFSYWFFFILSCNISFMPRLAGAHDFFLPLSPFPSTRSAAYVAWKLLHSSHLCFKSLSSCPITSTAKLYLFFIKMNCQPWRTKSKSTANSTTSNHSLHTAETPPCPAQDNNPIPLSQDSRIYGVLVKFGLWEIQIKAVSKQAKVGKVWRGEVVTPALTSCRCF